MLESFIKIGLSAMACILHTVGFWALWHVKQTNPYLVTQRLYLLNLSVAENFHSFFLGLFNLLAYLGYCEMSNYAFICAGGGAYLWYLSVMIMLTIDRFLTVYLNVRYLVIWNQHKTKIILKLCFIMAFIANIFFLIFFKAYAKSLKNLSVFVWFPIDNTFVLVAVVTYTYIILRVFNRVGYTRLSTTSLTSSSSSQNEEHGRCRRSTQSSIKSTQDVHTNSSYSWKTFIVPFLLIAAFALFIAFPDNTYFYYFVTGENMPKILDTLSFTFYPIGIMCDAIIYVLCAKDVRKYLIKKVYCCVKQSERT